MNTEIVRPLRQLALDQIERAVILNRYEQCGRVLSATADSLGLSHAAVRYKLQRWGVREYTGKRHATLGGTR